jgi:hypothetical protein
MKAKIKKGNILVLYAETTKELTELNDWYAFCNPVDDEYVDIVYKEPKKKKESPAKVIEIRVTGIPSEIHILKGDLTQKIKL